MGRLFLYLILSIVAGVYLSRFLSSSEKKAATTSVKPHNKRFQPKIIKEKWVQIYETASEAEADSVQARLEEEEIRCVLYEQGKKDISGNILPGIGIAVPKGLTSRAQTLISRMPV